MSAQEIARAIAALDRPPRGDGAAQRLGAAIGEHAGPKERSLLTRLLIEEGTTFTPSARLAVAELAGETRDGIAQALHSCAALPEVTFTLTGDFRTTDIQEPSAIAVLPDGFLLLVDDESGVHQARQPHPSAIGIGSQALAAGAFADAEGLAFDPASESVLTLLEDGTVWRQTVRRADGSIDVGRASKAGSLPSLGDGKSGWEGLCILPPAASLDGRAHVLAVHEKAPRVLGIFGAEFLAVEALIEVPRSVEGVEIRDLSDVAFDPRAGSVLLLSDESRAIFEFGLELHDRISEAKLRFRSRTPLPPLVDEGRLQPEGIDLDADGNVWIACDAGRRVLYLERGTYPAARR